MYQLLIFDWDGTLMDSAHKIATCIRASARDLSIPEPTELAAKNVIGLGLLEAMRTLFPDQPEAMAQQLVERYRHHWLFTHNTPQKLFSGVRAGMDHLGQTGCLLTIATGKSRTGLNRELDETALKAMFAVTRCADETRSKPHPQMLEELLEVTAIDPHKAIMIGDTSYDMEMARHVGIDSLGVGYGVHEPEVLRTSGALAVMNSFADLVDWFEQGRLEPAFSAQRNK